MTDPQYASDIAVLKSDVARMDQFFGRLDDAIEKIGDLSNTITKMLAVHDQRLNDNDDKLLRFQDQIDTNIRDLYKLINEAKTNIASGFAAFDGKVATIVDNKTEELSKKVDSLMKWRWLVVGGGLVIITVLGYIAPVVLGK